jgi:hypothetical protein
MKYIDDNYLDFAENVENFLKEGKVSVTRRKDCETVLQRMHDHV